MKNILFDIGNRIRDLRETEGYTQDYLAELSEISSKYLYEIETGKKGLSTKVLYRIVSALHTSADYILFGDRDNMLANEILSIIYDMDEEQQKKMIKILRSLNELSA